MKKAFFSLVALFLFFALPVQASETRPVRLIIPSIPINTVLEPVNTTPEGTVDVPIDPVNAAWFEQSVHPGEKGTSIIDGHFGWKNGIPAVFDFLNKIRLGDKIYIVDEMGATTTFIVRKLKIYRENEDSSGVFYSNDGIAHLNLITCEGVWDKAKKSYSGRLVVFADME